MMKRTKKKMNKLINDYFIIKAERLWKGKQLKDNEEDKYDLYQKKKKKINVWI